MRFSLITTLLLSAASSTLALPTSSTPPQKSIIVSYPKNTPDWVLQKAKDAIVSQGGQITHEYSIIKGFAATTPETAYAAVQGVGDGVWTASIEEDQVVSIS